MPYFTYDTSVFIARKLFNFYELPRSFRMSAVVQLEPIAGARDRSHRKVLEEAFLQYHRDDSVIVPNEDDWFLAGKILYLLTQARRHAQGGKLQRLPPGASQRLALDALIAVSARGCNAQVVTENWTDFKAIQHYCNTTVIKASNFFRRM